jgi:type III pantothenate kinase
MSDWLFDLGNTRLKFAPRLPDGRVGEVQAVAHDDAGAWLTSLPAGAVACVASVAAGHRRDALLQALHARFGAVRVAATDAHVGRLRIAYPEPGRLGVDRFLALLAASAEQGVGATLLVGVGTALTVDLLDADGLHRGGRIAASPALMRQALHRSAPVLPLAGGDYAEFAADTAAALASGCDGAALALVERSLTQATRMLDAPPRVWLHGGGAPALRAHLPAHAWVPHVVLRGLSAWQAHRFA